MVTTQHTIFHTQNTAIIQDDARGVFVLCIGGLDYPLDRFAFSSFKRKIKSIDLAAMICDPKADIEVIHLSATDNFIIVDIRQVIELKELLAGTSAMMELNSCIHKGIRRKAIHS